MALIASSSTAEATMNFTTVTTLTIVFGASLAEVSRTIPYDKSRHTVIALRRGRLSFANGLATLGQS